MIQVKVDGSVPYLLQCDVTVLLVAGVTHEGCEQHCNCTCSMFHGDVPSARGPQTEVTGGLTK